ncbi:MAG: polysaccharide lyase 6 family protein [Proteiniphilum sp.]|uniref:polysaccharide lyase 6 family protein n=1 Tax=Proteiniphilum sp. TaxID=1926877 RepID=UPI002AB84291|nr:polysaccharide lyase 6 family protein [Proteiniphilum sp.]MDY9919968.1 polysaccharide lyase 6 family protein [Proteiniphilum sp.]
MKRIALIVWFLPCLLQSATYKVSNITEYTARVKFLQAGDSIVLSPGVWKNVQLEFYGEGTEQKPITLTVEKPGQTTFEGLSCLNLYGNYLVVDGLVFVNGYTPTKSVIEFRKGTSKAAYHSVLKNCVIDHFNKPNRLDQDSWVSLWGQHNVVENCYFGGKKNQGCTFVIWPNGEGHHQNYHRIYRNHFGPRPRLGSNGGETIRVGTSQVSLDVSGTIIEGNLFERCNGEVEVISIKSCENQIIDNLFLECEGSVVLRHGNRNLVSGNYFIGNGKEFTGGVRVINAGHKVYNNYFYGLKGKDFRAPLVIMNGVPNSVPNRYHQVKDVEIMFNTWVDCVLPWQFCVGSDAERTDVPRDVTIANNIVYAPQEAALIKTFDKTDGIRFVDNILTGSKGNESGQGFLPETLKLRKGQGGLPLPLTSKTTSMKIEYVKTDIEGRQRDVPQTIGAFEMTGQEQLQRPSKSNCGPASWKYIPLSDAPVVTGASQTHQVAAGGDQLFAAVRKAKPGDVIVLTTEGDYTCSKKLVIDFPLTIQAAQGLAKRPVIQAAYEGNAVAVFELRGGSHLQLHGVEINGNATGNLPAKYAFITGKSDMTEPYRLKIDNCLIHGFKNTDGGSVFKAYPASFADSIVVINSTVSDSYRGFALNAEKEDKGVYNAEYILLKNTTFKDIEQWALEFYRGGNDESTLGGFLLIEGCTFDNVNNRKGQYSIRQTGLLNISETGSVVINSPEVKGVIRKK